MENIDGKESNMAKGISIAAELNEFKETLLNKKIIRHKMRRIQGKKHKMGTCEIDKLETQCKKFWLVFYPSSYCPLGTRAEGLFYIFVLFCFLFFA